RWPRRAVRDLGPVALAVEAGHRRGVLLDPPLVEEQVGAEVNLAPELVLAVGVGLGMLQFVGVAEESSLRQRESLGARLAEPREDGQEIAAVAEGVPPEIEGRACAMLRAEGIRRLVHVDLLRPSRSPSSGQRRRRCLYGTS